ncbi:hypothetical protein [Roseovarius aestuariivivens]|uniref:hypothetical protein n=1 Tax=Roseovarius aestuariivivens TaxID=1888910 RepID=UPI0010818C60|nr:hypothetical protein [Roseovarius aestuariivivens]
MKFSLYVIIPAGIAIAFFAMQYLTATEDGGPGGMTRAEIESELQVQGYAQVLDLIEDSFPDRHEAYMDDVAQVISDPTLPQARKGQRVLTITQDFTDEMRRENAVFVGRATEDGLLELQRATLAVLVALESTPELCVQAAVAGPNGLARYDKARIDPALTGRVSRAVFEAIAEGRVQPAPRDAPSEADWELFLKDWLATAPEMAEVIRVFLAGETEDSARYCAGAISFLRQLLQDGSPEGLRIMAEYSQTAAAR